MYKKYDIKKEIHLLCIHDIILHKIGLVRIVSSFPSILYFVTDMFFKINGRICSFEKRKKVYRFPFHLPFHPHVSKHVFYDYIH